MRSFRYIKIKKIPPLAWLAVLTKGEETISVTCGEAVITTETWFTAGVWDGELAKGEMDTCTTSCCTGMKLNVCGGG